jgi:glycosyltransferase involved in cell wall biosynthesis
MHRMTTEIPRVGLELGTDLARIPDAVAACARHDPAFRAVARTGTDPGTEDIADLPLISVVIPVHNGAAFIRDAVECVLGQEYPRIELIVVNDASTDDTEDIVLSLPHDICYYEFRTNLGPAEARNRGVREAAGDFIAFLDADDLWPAGTLERLVRVFLADRRLQFVKGRAQVLTLDPDSGAYVEDGDPADAFPYYLGSALYRRSAFDRVGPFDRSMHFGEDSDWYLRASEIGLEGYLIDDVTLLVRRHGDNMTWGKTQLELNRVRVLKRVLDRKRERGEL